MTREPCTAIAANWLWLTDGDARERAVVVTGANDTWRRILTPHFANVDTISVEMLRAMLEDSRCNVSGGGALLPFADESVDCVVLPGVIGAWSSVAKHTSPGQVRSRVLHEMRRILRERGALVLTGRNRQWYGMRPSLADFGLRRAVARAGFPRVRAYFAEPSASAPRTILPSRRAAALAFEKHEHTQRGRAPRLLTRIGLYAMAYPARIIMASA